MAAKITIENFDTQKFIEKTLRGAFKKTPHYNEAKRRAKREYFEIHPKTGNPHRRVHLECAECHRCFRDEKRQIAVDHIEPVIDPSIGYVDFQTYISRLFCSIDNLQILCKDCHSVKSSAENAIRKEMRKRLKDGNDLSKSPESTDVGNSKKRSKSKTNR